MDRSIHIRTEEQILVPHRLNYVPESGFENGQLGRVPGLYSGCVGVYDRDFDVWVLQRDYSTCRRS